MLKTAAASVRIRGPHHQGYQAVPAGFPGVGATRDLARTVVYSVNSTDAKAAGQNQRTLGIAVAAFA